MSSETKNQIIETAREIFADKGFKGATTSEIAKNAGISEGTIYRHFESKNELLMECVAPVLQYILDNMETELPKVDNLREFVKKNLEMRLKLYNKYHSTFKILINEMPYSKDMMDQYIRFVSMKEEKIYELMSQTIKLGKVRSYRNYILFGLGQAMSLFFYSNLKNWSQTGSFKLSGGLIDIEDDHVIEDLTDYIMYGISGMPEEFAGNNSDSLGREV